MINLCELCGEMMMCEDTPSGWLCETCIEEGDDDVYYRNEGKTHHRQRTTFIR